MRERELYSYDLNIQNYTLMLADMTDQDWPEHLEQYRGKTADQIPDEFDAICNELNYRDRVTALLKTEKSEREKSRRVYEALLSQIPEKDRATLLQAAAARFHNTQQ